MIPTQFIEHLLGDLRQGLHSIRSWLTRIFAGFLLVSSGVIHAAQGGTLLVVGDSLSAEYGLARGSGWVTHLTEKIHQVDPTIEVVNASISGDTSRGGLARFEPLLKEHQPKWVLLELGANDALRGLSLSTLRANLTAMTEAAQNMGAHVVLIGVQVPPNYGRRYTQEFAQSFETVANQTGASLVPFLLKDIADVPDALRWFQDDRIHPNEAAQPIMANNVWPTLQPLL